MSQCQCSAQQSVTVPGYLSTAERRIYSETPAQKKARRRACERKAKPRDRMISDWAIEQWSDGQRRLITFGYEHKLTSPGVPALPWLGLCAQNDPVYQASRVLV